MGDALRRLAAKCLHATVLSSVSEHLLPLQVGVKVPGGKKKSLVHPKK